MRASGRQNSIYDGPARAFRGVVSLRDCGKTVDMDAPAEFADITADVLARIRSRAPRVHCITNSVAQAYTANMLLAAGAIPSMTISREEVGAFVRRADALLVNLGTFDAERPAAIELALGAKGRGRKG